MDKQPIFDEIATLLEQGKTPSLALIKSRLNSAYPLPVLIDALKRYQATPQQFTSHRQASPEPAQSKTQEQRIEQLEATLQQLMQRIEQLENQLVTQQKAP